MCHLLKLVIAPSEKIDLNMPNIGGSHTLFLKHDRTPGGGILLQLSHGPDHFLSPSRTSRGGGM